MPTAHDVRRLKICKRCGSFGDGRRMLKMADGHWHDHCVIGTLTAAQVLQLPSAERDKITIGAAGPDLMRKLMESRHLQLVA